MYKQDYFQLNQITMPRVKKGVTKHARHKKVLKAAKGYRAGRKNLYREAKRAVMKAGQHAYVDRRKKKRVFRRLWITRINAAVKAEGLTYSKFINGLAKAIVIIDRKIMADMAVNNELEFKELVKIAKG